MINPNKTERTCELFTLIKFDFPGMHIEKITVEHNGTKLDGYSDLITVKNKYGYELKDKRLKIGKKYQVYCRFSIMSDTYQITALKEVA